LGRAAAGLYVLAVFVFLFMPLVLVVVFSFNSSPRLSFPMAGVSLRWYRAVAGDSEFRSAFVHTMEVGVGTALVAGCLGLTAALGIVQMGSKTRTVLLALVLVPFGFPGLLYAIGLASFYHQIGLGFTLWGTAAGHVVIALPFVFLAMGAALDRFRHGLLDAARNLGAGPWTAFRTVTLPLIMPALLGAMLLAMAISVDEFVVATFTAGQSKTLPMLLYGRINLGVTPTLNVVGTILLGITLGFAGVSAWQTRKRH
jgi:ABC-type spermidine/putrescine transport system permease subunit II